MDERQIDELFERFRSCGEVAALGEVFDLASGTLHGVARHLVRDASQAEDLVQATFLTAIEKAQQFDPERPVLPWLLGILTLHARDFRRKRARDPEPDRLHRPTDIDPSGSAESKELEGAVAEAVGSMPDIYREVLGAHLVQGLRPEQIARRLEVAPGTVRVRLHRGLKRLRAALPAGFALGTAAVLAPAGHAAVRRQVLENAQETVSRWRRDGSLPPSTPATAVPSGGLSFSVLGAVVGALALAGALALVVRGARRSAAPVYAAEAGGEVGSGPLPTAAADAASLVPASAADAERRSVESVGAPLGPGTWLVGRLSLPEGLRAEEAQVIAQDLALGADPATAYADDEGRYAVLLDPIFTHTLGEPDDVTVRVAHPHCAPEGAVVGLDQVEESAADRREVRLDFSLRQALGRVYGLVTPPPTPEEELQVVLFPADLPPNRGARDLVTHATVESDGSFHAVVRDDGEWIVAALRTGWRPARQLVTITPEENQAEVLLASDRGGVLSGRVRLADATPVEGARLEARVPVGPGERALWVGGRTLIVGPDVLEMRDPFAVVGPGGAFELTGLPGRASEVSLDLGEAFARRGFLRGAQEVTDPILITPAIAVDLAFPYVSGVLEVRTDGVLVGSAQVLPGNLAWRNFRTDPLREELSRRAPVVDRTDAAGHYVICVVAPAEPGEVEPERPAALALQVVKPGYGLTQVDDWFRRDVADGAVHRVELRTGDATSDLVLHLGSLPAEEIERFRASTPRASGNEAGPAVSRLVDREGDDLVIRDLLPGRYRLDVRPTMAGATGWFGSYVCNFSVDVEVGPGQRVLHEVPAVQGGRIRITFAGWKPGLQAHYSIEVRDADGRVVPVRAFQMDPATNVRRSSNRLRAGRVNQTWPNLLPGDYEVRITAAEGSQPEVRSVRVEAGRTTPLRIVLGE